jgi:hypothetical protein
VNFIAVDRSIAGGGNSRWNDEVLWKIEIIVRCKVEYLYAVSTGKWSPTF